jgi:cysteine-rich repeat protein
VHVTNAFGTTTSEAAVLTVTTNQAPTPAIAVEAPRPLWHAGDTIVFSGTATDPEDGPLGIAALTWQVDFHHDAHAHPFLPPVTGVAGGSFAIPTVGDVDPDVWYRISLTAVDSGGRATTVAEDLLPELATMALATDPPGLQVLLDDQPRPTPITVTGVVGFVRILGAPGVQTAEGARWRFVGWSDGGEPRHPIAVPPGASTWVAHYRREAAVDLGTIPWVRASNGYGPVEIDRANGGGGAGDGPLITLNGVVYPTGLGVHAPSEVVYDLGAAWATFRADVGVDDFVGTRGAVVFQVWADGVQLWNSGVLTGTSPTQTVSVDVTGRRELRLVVTDGGDGNVSDHADWAAARLVPLTVCGDGIVDGDEACDDGNAQGGDCCDGLCELEAAGAPCSDAGGGAGTCDAQGTCVPGPPTTSTTLPPGFCSACTDADGDGAPDFADPRCCSTTGSLTVRRLRLRALRGGTRCRLHALVEGLPGLAPAQQDLHLALIQGSGPLLCARVPAAAFEVRASGALRFRDPLRELTSAAGLRRVVLRPDGDGTWRLSASGRRLSIPAAEGAIDIVVAFRDAALAAGPGSACAAAAGPP